MHINRLCKPSIFHYVTMLSALGHRGFELKPIHSERGLSWQYQVCLLLR